MYSKCGKRIIDFFISLIGLIVLSPIFFLLSLCIKLDTKGPILFCQERTGKDNSSFYIYKFRTMRIDTPKDIPTHLLENPEQYITRMGKFLRKTSLDELPQLLNIVKGDMAIVGPRPSLTNQYDLNELRDQNGASSVRPGLTGLAQISGRDELPIPIKADLDGQYVKRITFIGDLSLFFKTFTSVLKSEGIQEGKQE